MSREGQEGAAPGGRPFGAPGSGARATGWALIARAVADHHHGDADAAVTILSDAEEPRLLPASHFFRPLTEMPPVEQEALRRSHGRVLDVGAGAGAHALVLQEAGHPVTALELSELCVEVMRGRGVRDARRADLRALPGEERWDTVLMLMNGTTLTGSPSGLVELFRAASLRLAAGGCILIDSTDLREGEGGRSGEAGAEVGDGPGPGSGVGDGRYAGEVHLQVSYQGERSDPFPVLYAHPELLAACAEAAGLQARVVARGEECAYLAELRAAEAPDTGSG